MTVVALCLCSHAERIHGDDGCRLPDCGCSGFDAAEPATPSVAPTKQCTGCGETKPIGEFYLRYADGRSNERIPKCRDCNNTRVRVATPARVLRHRARHRATAELITRHKTEFEALLEDATAEVTAEAERLAAVAAVADDTHRHDQAAGLPRLRPGPRRKGQDVTERLDVARCPECVGYHDRGHRCDACGAEPHAEAS